MIFNNRKKAGSGAGEHIEVRAADPFAPKRSPLSQHLNDLKVARAKQGKKPLKDNAAYMKDYIKGGSKIKPPTTPDPFA